MNEPLHHTEERYCYACFDVTETEVITYRSYVLAECLSCHKVQVCQH
jgi:hypothetical protein